MLIKSLLILLLVLSVSNADNTNDELQPSYVDGIYTNFSDKILTWSAWIDTKVSQLFEDPEDTELADVDTPKNTVDHLDTFFQNQKFLDQSDRTYLRVRAETTIQSKESNDFNFNLHAQLPLSRSKKRFKVFIDNLSKDNAKDLLKDSINKEEPSSGVGLHYFAPEIYGFNGRYSIGISSLTPFVRARYNRPLTINTWLIDPIQFFQYSSEKEFQEETHIYFDKKLTESSFFRVLLHRKTQSDIEGMAYGLALQYYARSKKDKGFSFSQSFEGNTEYSPSFWENHDLKQTKTYSGINNYTTSLRYRESFWRKWIFYEIGPGVNFHKKYDYKPNYSLNFLVDSYFGNYR